MGKRSPSCIFLILAPCGQGEVQSLNLAPRLAGGVPTVASLCQWGQHAGHPPGRDTGTPRFEIRTTRRLAHPARSPGGARVASLCNCCGKKRAATVCEPPTCASSQRANLGGDWVCAERIGCPREWRGGCADDSRNSTTSPMKTRGARGSAAAGTRPSPTRLAAGHRPPGAERGSDSEPRPSKSGRKSKITRNETDSHHGDLQKRCLSDNLSARQLP